MTTRPEPAYRMSCGCHRFRDGRTMLCEEHGGREVNASGQRAMPRKSQSRTDTLTLVTVFVLGWTWVVLGEHAHAASIFAYGAFYFTTRAYYRGGSSDA